MKTKLSNILDNIFENNVLSLGYGNIRVKVVKGFVSVFVLEGEYGKEEVTYSISLPKDHPNGKELVGDFLKNHTDLED